MNAKNINRREALIGAAAASAATVLPLEDEKEGDMAAAHSCIDPKPSRRLPFIASA
jgi:hypothetical protein